MFLLLSVVTLRLVCSHQSGGLHVKQLHAHGSKAAPLCSVSFSKESAPACKRASSFAPNSVVTGAAQLGSAARVKYTRLGYAAVHSLLPASFIV